MLNAGGTDTNPSARRKRNPSKQVRGGGGPPGTGARQSPTLEEHIRLKCREGGGERRRERKGASEPVKLCIRVSTDVPDFHSCEGAGRDFDRVTFLHRFPARSRQAWLSWNK